MRYTVWGSTRGSQEARLGRRPRLPRALRGHGRGRTRAGCGRGRGRLLGRGSRRRGGAVLHEEAPQGIVDPAQAGQAEGGGVGERQPLGRRRAGARARAGGRGCR
eukprot:1534158-Alexandrium_andersonii.AAC.1